MGLASLDEKTQAYLNGILAKDPSALTLADKQFLRARAQYVGNRSRTKFQSVFNEELPAQEAQPKEEVEEPQNTPFEESDGEDEE